MRPKRKREASPELTEDVADWGDEDSAEDVASVSSSSSNSSRRSNAQGGKGAAELPAPGGSGASSLPAPGGKGASRVPATGGKGARRGRGAGLTAVERLAVEAVDMAHLQPACVIVSPNEPVMAALLQRIWKEDLALVKDMSVQQEAGDDRQPTLWFALPRDERPQPRDLTDRAGQVAYVLKDLFNFHRGELVEVASEWHPHTGPPPAQLVGKPFALGHNLPPASGGGARSPATGGGGAGGPDFSRPLSSLVVPDLTAADKCWVRTATVTTWARLAHFLGRKFTAEALHAFYMSRELITTKKVVKPGAEARSRAMAKWKAKGAPRTR